jgi:hypothetical protein
MPDTSLSFVLFRHRSMPIGRGVRGVFLALITFASVICSGAHALAQDRTADYSDPSKVVEQVQTAPQTLRAPSQGTNEVKIDLDQLGAGDVPKFGAWNGIRVLLRDANAEARDVIVRLTSTDSDGDQPQQQVEVSTNPGVTQGVWLYTRLGFNEFARSNLVVSVYEALPQDFDPSSTPREERYRAGRLLGRLDIVPPPAKLVDASIGLYGVIGERPLGLRAYSQRPQGGQAWAEFHHELTEVVLGLKPDTLPDRWMGLDAFSVIVWASGDISELRGERAEALENWINRGGHFVVVVPAVSQMWTNENSNTLLKILPVVNFNRSENVDLMPYRPLITARTDGRFPAKGVLHTFTFNPRALPSEAMSVLNGPKGDCVVARRLVGAGAVTLVGFDFNDTRFSQFENIEADIFWHRVLGRAGNLKPKVDPNRTTQFSVSDRQRWLVDRQIPGIINITGVSAVGALVGFLVFAVYWVVVGPPLFLLLKRKDLHRHSWVAFIAGGVLFTILAWGLATFLRPLSVRATHFTVVDHIFGQPVQRARMWANVLVPTYGSATIGVGSAAGDMDRSQNSVAAFESPSEDLVTVATFPDSRGYPIDTRSPDTIRVPVRATVKQVQADWSGSPQWEMIRPVLPPGAPALPEGQSPALTVVRAGVPVETGTPLMTGSIRHSMPGTLREGFIIAIRGQSEVSGNIIDDQSTYADGRVFQFTEWPANEDIDLQALSLLQDRGRFLWQWLSSQLPVNSSMGLGIGGGTNEGGSRQQRFLAASFMHQFPTADFKQNSSPVVATRQLLHGFDMSRWFTQPCIIVIGFLGEEGQTGADSPVPLFVDGEAVPNKGLTMVRWVYPLPASPPGVKAFETQIGRNQRADEKNTTNESGGSKSKDGN